MVKPDFEPLVRKEEKGKPPKRETGKTINQMFLVMQNGAEASYRKGDLHGAKSGYQAAVELNPASAKAHYGLGTTCDYLGELEQALQAYRQVQKLDRHSPWIQISIAQALIGMQELREARLLLLKLLKANPHPGHAKALLGIIALEERDGNAGSKYFQEAITHDPDLAEHHLRRGDTLLAQNQYRRAVQSYLAAASMDPQLAGAYFGMGASYAKMGYFEWAIQSYENFLSIESNSERAESARVEIRDLKDGKVKR